MSRLASLRFDLRHEPVACVGAGRRTSLIRVVRRSALSIVCRLGGVRAMPRGRGAGPGLECRTLRGLDGSSLGYRTETQAESNRYGRSYALPNHDFLVS